MTYGKLSFFFKFSDFRIDSNPEKLKIVEPRRLLKSNVYARTRISLKIAKILDFKIISDCYTWVWGVWVCVGGQGDHACVCGGVSFLINTFIIYISPLKMHFSGQL